MGWARLRCAGPLRNPYVLSGRTGFLRRMLSKLGRRARRNEEESSVYLFFYFRSDLASRARTFAFLDPERASLILRLDVASVYEYRNPSSPLLSSLLTFRSDTRRQSQPISRRANHPRQTNVFFLFFFYFIFSLLYFPFLRATRFLFLFPSSSSPCSSSFFLFSSSS